MKLTQKHEFEARRHEESKNLHGNSIAFNRRREIGKLPWTGSLTAFQIKEEEEEAVADEGER